MFERDDRIGGLLMYGIPPMKLEKNIIDRRVKLMAQEGVNFVTSAWIGKTHPTAKLQAEFDAIVLAGGATAARDLQVEGRNLKGVHFAMEFLLKSCKSLLDSNFADRQFIDAKGKNVIVIGGGDTGTDCVGTSLRHGCKSLVQFEILRAPARRARGRQPVAAVAAHLQDGLRPGRGGRAVRRRPAPLRHGRPSGWSATPPAT